MNLILDLKLFFSNNGTEGTKTISGNGKVEKGLERRGSLSLHMWCAEEPLSATYNVRNKKSRKIKQDPPRLLSRQPAYHTLIQTR